GASHSCAVQQTEAERWPAFPATAKPASTDSPAGPHKGAEWPGCPPHNSLAVDSHWPRSCPQECPSAAGYSSARGHSSGPGRLAADGRLIKGHLLGSLILIRLPDEPPLGILLTAEVDPARIRHGQVDRLAARPVQYQFRDHPAPEEGVYEQAVDRDIYRAVQP